MVQGKEALKSITGKYDADKVEDITDDLAELYDLNDQISQAISRPTGDIADDDELLAELDLLEEEVAATESIHKSATVAQPAASVFTMPAMPSVPMGAVQTGEAYTRTESEEEKELRELAASMMM